MFTGLFQLIVSFVVAAIVYYASTIPQVPIIQKLGTIVAIIIAVIGLLQYLKPLLGG